MAVRYVVVSALLALSSSCVLGSDGETTASTTVEISFEVELLDGSTFDLKEHLAETGKPVVVNLWASWCRPCRREMPAIDAVASRRPDITVIGVAVQDTRAAAEAFAAEIGVSYLIGFDHDNVVNDLFLVPGLPMTIFINPAGNVAGRSFGEMTADELEDRIDLFLGT